MARLRWFLCGCAAPRMIVIWALWMKKDMEKMPKAMEADSGRQYSAGSVPCTPCSAALTNAEVKAKARMVRKQKMPTPPMRASSRIVGRLASGTVIGSTLSVYTQFAYLPSAAAHGPSPSASSCPAAKHSPPCSGPYSTRCSSTVRA